ncbi:cytochrome P450 [Annulohypoxylon maeteangense]|uniref:cytochrome P450 n=1 Tax=Annulohypoxylon maeteangense TaxID=1927788 RepID=UPI0020082220|nr:cytochrome P450 [Annulohypoxylon maeteangense]KAI0885396.1 cytochrome P450 [Annulohypoxylon maeteangense]
MEVLQRVLPTGLPVSIQVIAATIVLGIVYSLVTAERPFTGFPVVSFDGKSPAESWMFHGKETLEEGLRRFSGPFQVITGTGPKIVLPNKFADDIRSHPSLDFNRAFAKDFLVHYPGFDGFRVGLSGDELIQETVRVKLTQSLGLITEDLVDETTDALHVVLGESKEWTTRFIRDDALEIVARLSSRVFLGSGICRNRRWLDIAKSYTIDSFVTTRILRAVPSFVRPIAFLLLPQSRTLRKAVRDARDLIDPEVERRKAAVDAAKAAGLKPPKVADTIGWMYEIARGRKKDFVAGQLSLTTAAIHTTTETSCSALLDICEYPEVAQQLREEIIQVIGEHGWAKTSLSKLKLMDSFLKEGQRVRPMSSSTMHRYVEKKVEISDGTTLPQGSRVVIASNFMDPTIYPEPEKFDAARFLKMRQQPGQENNWQFVTTSPSYTLFGHGQHACPGRFFAANEVKIALCHLLLKYDWRFVPGEGRPAPTNFEGVNGVDQKSRVQIRRRQAEIDLDLSPN